MELFWTILRYDNFIIALFNITNSEITHFRMVVLCFYFLKLCAFDNHSKAIQTIVYEYR